MIFSENSFFISDLKSYIHRQFNASPFSFDLPLDQLADLVYIKDVNYRYVAINNTMLPFLQDSLNSPVIGLEDFEVLPNRHEARSFRATDKKILNDRIVQTVFDNVTDINGKVVKIQGRKIPIVVDNHCIGLLGLGNFVKEVKNQKESILNKILSMNMSTFINDSAKKIAVDFRHRSIKLSKRQTQCLLLLICGKTLAQIAVHLGLTYNTVRNYLENIKNKFGLSSRSALIQAVLESDFLCQFE